LLGGGTPATGESGAPRSSRSPDPGTIRPRATSRCRWPVLRTGTSRATGRPRAVTSRVRPASTSRRYSLARCLNSRTPIDRMCYRVAHLLAAGGSKATWRNPPRSQCARTSSESSRGRAGRAACALASTPRDVFASTFRVADVRLWDRVPQAVASESGLACYVKLTGPEGSLMPFMLPSMSSHSVAKDAEMHGFSPPTPTPAGTIPGRVHFGVTTSTAAR
jgi:hypothetical protein